MYRLIVAKKKQAMGGYDYTFEGFQPFYQIASLLTVPLKGKYAISVKSDSIEEVRGFIKDEATYASLMVDIYIPEAIFDYIAMRDASVKLAETVSPYTVFKELIQQRSILFDSKRTINILYNSIPHEYEDMCDALDSIIAEFGEKATITETKLSTMFVLNKMIYPRQVTLAYLWLERWRASKLKNCLECMGSDVLLGAMVKNIKSFMQQKLEYYQTGKANGVVQNIDMRNLLIMYRIFVLERGGMNDVELLLDLYERGLSSYDLVQKK